MKRYLICILFLAASMCLIGTIYSHLKHVRFMRRVSALECVAILKSSYKDYLTTGSVTNYGNVNYQIWLDTNTDVTINGTQYHCLMTARAVGIYGACNVAMTTNFVFILLEDKRPPKIIGMNHNQ